MEKKLHSIGCCCFVLFLSSLYSRQGRHHENKNSRGGGLLDMNSSNLFLSVQSLHGFIYSKGKSGLPRVLVAFSPSFDHISQFIDSISWCVFPVPFLMYPGTTRHYPAIGNSLTLMTFLNNLFFVSVFYFCIYIQQEKYSMKHLSLSLVGMMNNGLLSFGHL